MKIKKSPQYKAFQVLNTVILLCLTIATLYPVYYIAIASVSDSNELIKHMGLLFKPLGLNFQAYLRVFQNQMIVSGYLNTFKILILGLSINMCLTILGAYVLSRKDLPGRRFMMLIIIFTMYFSGGLIPAYLNVRSLGLYNTIWALVLPGAISTYNLIVMRTSFESVPQELEEAATIDGASEVGILLNVILPLSLATISVIALYYTVGIWNAWFNSMIYIKDRAKYPLQLVLREILIQGNTDDMMHSVGDVGRASVAESVKYAVIIVSTLPIMLIYPIVQKNFVKGVMIGAVKG